MRIGELSQISGVSRDTIRFYERNGLITSVEGASATNNYRNYSEDNVIWLRFFAGAREAGMSIYMVLSQPWPPGAVIRTRRDVLFARKSSN